MSYIVLEEERFLEKCHSFGILRHDLYTFDGGVKQIGVKGRELNEGQREYFLSKLEEGLLYVDLDSAKKLGILR